MATGALLRKVERLEAQNAELTDLVDAKSRRMRDMVARIEYLERRVYGPSRETISPDQLRLAFAEEEVPVPPHAHEAPDEEETRPREERKKHPGRTPLPDSLPRERIEYALADCSCQHCGAQMERIGEEVSEELEYVPASLLVREHARLKYGCKSCDQGIALAPGPARPLHKSRPGPGLLAHVIVSKYGDHLPLHRQEGILQRHGVEIPKATLCNWVRDVADQVMPLYDAMKKSVLAQDIIQSDDTPVQVQENYRSAGTKRCFLWEYRSLDGLVVFDFTSSRSRAGPSAFLAGWKGKLQTDAYAGYNELHATGDVVEVGCWAHARRYFFEALGTEEKLAMPFLVDIRRLYAVEAEAKGMKPAERHALRAQKSVPLLAEMAQLLEAGEERTLPQSGVGKAIRYTRSNWTALNRYVEDGRLEIDNNACERQMRAVAVGRKNWLFAGSKDGGRRAAVLYSVLQSAKAAGVEPFAYLRDVLERIGTMPVDRVGELLPARWKAAREGR